jgi:hypothetical protein
MGVDAEDSLIAEKKWGEPACVSEITFSIPDRETTQRTLNRPCSLSPSARAIQARL